MTSNPRLGRCYELSCKEVAVTPGSPWTTLVHGIVRDTHLGNTGALIFHAWAEGWQPGQDPSRDEPFICDPVLDIVLPRMAYLRMFDATEVYRYSAAEAARHAIESRHYGPWEEMPSDINQVTLPALEARAAHATA